MANFDLDELEQKVTALIELNQRLRNENDALLSRQESLTAERDEWMNKTVQTRSRIEAMLARLRAMEEQL
ncbi:TIGR02449 family protein [Chromatium okenii]|uniref:TIGR02449 family protein n=1 Tax=Chromatium okenii TaxID=61644 RepID=UPI0026EC9BC1|nr:TIGR02449 family protein [Chromatium okenii]MBV5308052.1 TIGR02449 family protein [Chromatium okenii]